MKQYNEPTHLRVSFWRETNCHAFVLQMYKLYELSPPYINKLSFFIMQMSMYQKYIQVQFYSSKNGIENWYFNIRGTLIHSTLSNIFYRKGVNK